MAVSAVAALVSTGASWAAGTLTASLAVTFATNFAISATLSAVSKALAPKQDLSQFQGLTTTVKEPTAARPIIYGTTRVGGVLAYVGTSHSTGKTDNKYLDMIVAISGHEVNAVKNIYFGDELVWSNGSYQNGWDLGDFYASVYDGTQTTADAQAVSNISGWTSDHKLLGCAYAYIRLAYDAERYPNGIPNISFLVEGKKVYDPRTTTTVFSNNPALCIYDYISNADYGLGENAVDEQTVISAANACDVLVDLDGGGSQKRFTLDGQVSTAEKPATNIENMLSSMAGRVVYSGGQFHLYAGIYQNPSVSIDESMFVGEVALQTAQSRRSLYNGVKGVFSSEDDNYILTEYPAQISSEYQTEDGEAVYLDMTLPFTTNQVRAQRLAKLALLKSRQQRTISVPVNMVGLKIKAGDTIQVSSEKLGLTNALYEVVDYELNQDMSVNLVCIETDPSVYDWTTNDELPYVPAGDVDLYDGTAVAPTNLVTNARSRLLADGSYVSDIYVSWTAPDDVFHDHYYITWSDGTETSSSRIQENTILLQNLDPEVSYTINVYSINIYGRLSTALSGSKTTVVDTNAPSDISGASVTGGLQSIFLDWTNPTESDFDIVRIKVNSTNSQPATHSFVTRADSFTHDIGEYETTKHYWLAPVDRTGNVGNYIYAGTATTGAIDYSDVGNVPEVAGTFYLTLGDNNAPTDLEFNNAVGRDQIENDFVIVNKEFAFTYNGTSWTAVTEFIDGSLLVTGSISADDITTGTLNANDVTISNLTISYGSVTDTPTIPSATSDLTNDSGFIDDTDVVFTDDIANFITAGDVNSNVTSISGGVIQTGTAITVGTGDNVAIMSGADATYRLWAGDANAAYAPFKVTQSGVLYATGAIIDGQITAGTIDADNVTITGTLTADNLVNIPNVEATNMTQSMINKIEEIIVAKFGSDASTGYFDSASGTFNTNSDNSEICKISTFQHNGSDIDIDLAFSKSWQASGGNTPSVVVNIQRSPAGAGSWTTIKTQTVTGTSNYEPELGIYFATISGNVSVTDNPSAGNYDYRYYAGQILNLGTATISANLEANEQGEQIGTIDLANYAALAQDETITGNWTFSGATSGISYNDLSNKPTLITQTDIDNSISALVDSAPSTLDTLNELAAALGDDPNFATTVTNSIGTKWTQDNTKISNWDTAYTYSQVGHLPLTGGTLTGSLIFDNDSGLSISDATDGDGGKYSQISMNNHADLLVGTNLSLKSDHDLSQVVTHSEIGGSAVVFTGNNHSLGGGAIALYAQGNGGATADTIIAEEDWKVAIKSNEVSVSQNIVGSGTIQLGSHFFAGAGVSKGYYQDEINGAYRALGTDGNRGYYFQDYNGSNTRMYIGLTGTYAGKVGIGKITPSEALDVHGTARADTFKLGDSTVIDSSRNATFAKGSFTGTGTNGAPTLDIINNTATTFNHSVEVMTPNMTAGQHNIIVAGRSSNTKNAGYFGYLYSSAGSNNNKITFGHWGNDDLVTIDGLGNTNINEGALQIGGTTVIDSSRNLTNVASISSGNINAGVISSTISGNNYNQVNSTGTGEAMHRYNNSVSSYWYVGIRSSSQLVGNTGYHIYSTAAGRTVFGLTAAGEMRAQYNVIAYYSDDRLKTKVRNLDNALSKVCSLNGFIYVENEKAKELGYDSNKEQVGLSAQEVQNVLPQAVRLAPVDCEIDEDGNDKSISGEDYLTLDYAKVVPLLVEAIKELKSEIEELKNANSN
jgi:hypothetical protein